MKYLIVVLLLSVALNACSSSKEKPPVYLQSEDLAPLKYPDKLRTPKSTPLLAVPPLTHDNVFGVRHWRRRRYLLRALIK